MATLKQKIEAELKMRELVDEAGVPQPDQVEYGYECIRLFWHATKTVVVVELDDIPQGSRAVSWQARPT